MNLPFAILIYRAPAREPKMGRRKRFFFPSLYKVFMSIILFWYTHADTNYKTQRWIDMIFIYEETETQIKFICSISQPLRDGSGTDTKVFCLSPVLLYTRQYLKLSIKKLDLDSRTRVMRVELPCLWLKKVGSRNVPFNHRWLKWVLPWCISRRINNSKMVPRGTLWFGFFNHCSISCSSIPFIRPLTFIF